MLPSLIGPAVLALAWSRTSGLALVNHPLLLQLGAGALPLGAFTRWTLSRAVVLDGLESAIPPSAVELSELVRAERARCGSDHASWLAQAASAGKSIDLPSAEIEAGVRCYGCGGAHYHLDCPSDATASPAAAALAGYLRESSTLAGPAVVFRSMGWAHRTLLRAGLDGGGAYDGWVQAHATRWTSIADACEAALSCAGAGANEEATTASSLLYALVDAEAGASGLVDGAGGAMTLDEARGRVAEVEPGFREAQDRNAAFIQQQVLGREIPAPSSLSATGAAAAVVSPRLGSGGRGGAAAAAKLKAAQAYLEAKRAAGGASAGASDAAAAIRAARAAAGPASRAQAGGKSFLEQRRKQQAAAQYLVEKKRKEHEGREGAS